MTAQENDEEGRGEKAHDVKQCVSIFSVDKGETVFKLASVVLSVFVVSFIHR